MKLIHKIIYKWCVAFLFMMFVLYCVGPDAYAGNKHKIFILHSYHKEFPWVQDISDGIFASLDGKGYKDLYGVTDKIQYEYEMFHMDTKRRHSSSYLNYISKEAIHRIADFKPDVVIVCDDDALKYVGKHIVDNKIPIVFCGINGDSGDYGLLKKEADSGLYITGVLERYNYRELIRLIRQLLPKAKTFYIAYDDSPSSRNVVRRFGDEIKALDVELKGITLTNSYSKWKSVIKSLEGRVDFIMCDFIFTFLDDNGNHVSEAEATRWFVQNSHLPNFTSTTWQVKLGALGSVAILGFSQGYEAAQKAKQILNGISPLSIPITTPTVGSIDLNQERAEMLDIEIPFDLLTYANIHHEISGLHER